MNLHEPRGLQGWEFLASRGALPAVHQHAMSVYMGE